MKRTISTLAFFALALFALSASAHEHAAAGHDTSMHKSKTTSLRGEIVDTGCYLGHGARGAKHVDCATKYINNGMPMGLLTDKGVLYLITLNHDNADPYNKLKEMAAKTLTVSGTALSRGGMKGIDVTDFKSTATRVNN